MGLAPNAGRPGPRRKGDASSLSVTHGAEAERLDMHQLDCENDWDKGGHESENSDRWKVAENFGHDG